MGEPELEPSLYEEDEYGQKTFRKNWRWPNMHGGLKNATANPDQRLDMQGVQEPRSEVVLDKVSRQNYDYIHGKHGPSASLPVLVNLLNTQIEQLKTMKQIRELLEFRIPIGQQRAFSIVYSIAGFTHFDFTDTGASQTFGVPSGQIYNTPGRKLQKLKVINDGPADIQISTNLPASDRSAEIKLKAGEFDDSLDFPYPIIWSLNVAVIPNSGSGGSNSNTTIRCFYVV